MDDILESTPCELHVKLKNISMKVADGFALPSGHEATFNGNPITPGYARVGVDQVVPAYETLDLDYPGGEGERTLGEARHCVILWKKECIVFPNSVPRPPTPPPSPPRQQTPTLPETEHRVSPPYPSPPRQPYPSHPETERMASPRYQAPPRQHSPSHPETEPSVSPRYRYPSSPKRRRAQKKKPEPPVKKKLAYDMTDEELDESVNLTLQAHFGPKAPPPPKEKIPDEVVHHIIDAAKPAEKRPVSDYERCITKSYASSQKRQKSSGSIKCGKIVPQLREQAVQSISPLKVSANNVVITDADKENARMLGITVEQFLEIEEFPPLDQKEMERQYVPGEPLVLPDDEKLLTTQMYKLHDWYMREIKKGMESLMVKVEKEHYVHKNALWIENSEFFQLFNQKALDKSIVSCYCL